MLCKKCGAVCPWDPATEAELYGYWIEQHPDAVPERRGGPTESLNAAVARTYLAADWKVFPVWWPINGRCACPQGAACDSPGKHPITVNGFKDASDDEATVADWWTRYPQANIGLPAGDNGLAVLDVDPHKGGVESERMLRQRLEDDGEPLPATLTAITGSGGRHYIYEAPVGGIKNGSNVFGLPGLDTRGRGGYIVAAPSGHVSGGAYEWVNPFVELEPWPAILTRLMDPPKPKSPMYTGPAKPIGDRYVAKAVEAELTAVASTGPGARNDRLNVASFNLGTFVGAGLLDEGTARRELYRAALACGLGEHESAATIASGLRSGTANPRSVAGR